MGNGAEVGLPIILCIYPVYNLGREYRTEAEGANTAASFRLNPWI